MHCQVVEGLRRQHSAAATFSGETGSSSASGTGPVPHLLWFDVRPSMPHACPIDLTEIVRPSIGCDIPGITTQKSSLEDNGHFLHCLGQLFKTPTILKVVVEGLCGILRLPGVGHRNSFIILLTSTYGLHRASL